MLKKEFGFSLVEVVIALGILGGAAYVVMQSSSSLQSSKKQIESKGQITELQSDVVSNVRRILFETNDTAGRKTLGVCKLVKPDPVAKPPVGPIYTNLKDFSTLLTKDRFKEFLSDWDLTSSAFCKTQNDKCFKLSANAQVAQTVKSMSPILKVTITPVNMNPKDGELYKPISSKLLQTDIDVKSVGFTFDVAIEFEENDKKKIIQQETFEWMGLAGYCDYKIGAKFFKLSFSGMELISGNDVIFNRAGFDTNKDAPVDVKFRSIVAQAGIYRPNGQYIFTDKSKNIVTSCKENTFRCPQVNSNQRKYDDLSVVADVNYRTSNYVASSSSMNTKISYDIRRSGSNNPVSFDRYFGDGVDCSIKSQNGDMNPSCLKQNSLEKPLTSSHMVSVTIWDRNTISNANNICREICQENSNYNTSGTNPDQRWAGYMKFEFVDYGKQQELVVSDRIGCTACYMKNCDQFGLGTFGPMHEMPYQPLDSVIPECSVNESPSILNEPLPFSTSQKQGSPWDSSKSKCISAKLDATGEQLIFTPENCNDNLPVMCYGFGQYLLARDLSTGASSLAQVKYEDAASRCIRLGHEIVRKPKMDEFVGGPIAAPVVNGFYNFLNLTIQGIFIAPHSSQDVRVFSAWMKRLGIPNTQKFWVGMRRDGVAGVSPRLPVIPNSHNSEIHALYYDDDKKLAYNQFKIDIPNNKSSGAAHPILFHNLKYKGVRLYKDDDPLSGEKIKFLCRKKNYPFALFLSKKTSTKISDGPDYCDEDSGVFLPPLNSYEWVQAMILIEPIDENYSFPVGTYTAGAADFGKAWVAYQTDASDLIGVNYKVFPSNQVKDKFLSTENYAPLPGDPYFVLDGMGRYVNPRAVVKSDKLTGSLPIQADKKFRVKVGGQTIEHTFNAGGTGALNLDYDQIATEMNTKLLPKATMTVYDDGSNKFFKISSMNMGYKIEILTSDLASTFKFSEGESSTGPTVKELCKAADGKLNAIAWNSSCNGSKISFSNVSESENFKILWSLYNFSDNSNFGFYL